MKGLSLFQRGTGKMPKIAENISNGNIYFPVELEALQF